VRGRKSRHPGGIGTGLDCASGSGACGIKSHRPFGVLFLTGVFRGLIAMKIVTAVIKPFKLDEVRDALTAIGVHGLTVTEVRGYGRQRGHSEIYRGSEYSVNSLPKLKIEVAAPADRVESIIDAISGAAKTGEIGDGKIFVSGIDRAVRIRTGEVDELAL
jgi:nitrogen regulatory protein P-II 2